MEGSDSSYCGSRKKGTRRTENVMGWGAVGDGFSSTVLIARLRCFFPMYPLGHIVSEMSSIGITSAFPELLERDRTKVPDIGWEQIR